MKKILSFVLAASFLISLCFTQSAQSPQTAKKTVQPITYVGGITIPNTAYSQSMIQKYISQYTTNFGKKNLYEILDNGEMYRLYVRQELKKRNMPPALEYLPFVESEYNPLATSKSGARGMWQFMENSITPFMKKTQWVDERLDPWISTDAALSKLQDNYKTFKNWPIAIAAYNCGAGAMKKILKASPKKDFWYIAEKGLLRDQSVQYIPKLLALSELSVNGAKYGVAVPPITQSRYFADFDYISLNFSVRLDYLENYLRLTPGTLKKLNPALLKGVTPPDDKYRLRLPSGLKNTAAAYIKATMKPHQDSSKFKTYTVKKGDTLYSIAKANKVTVEAIRKENGMSEKDVLKTGKILYIPVK